RSQESKGYTKAATLAPCRRSSVPGSRRSTSSSGSGRTSSQRSSTCRGRSRWPSFATQGSTSLTSSISAPVTAPTSSSCSTSSPGRAAPGSTSRRRWKPRLERFGERIRYLVTDVERLAEGDLEPASVVVSSRALHHLAHEKLEQLYARLAGVVEPGGYLFNLDHVGAPGDLERAYRRIRTQFLGERKQELKPHRQDAPLARADEHLAWVGRAGFENADTPWRTLYTALIAARRPAP